MSEESGTVAMGDGGLTTNRIINFLIIALAVALAAVGGYLIYTNYIQGEPADPTLERAAEEWKKAVEEDPSNSLARANLGATYLDMGEVDKAIEELEIALEMVPDSFSYTFNLGLAYKEKGEMDRAADYFLQSADLTPEGEKYVAYYETALAHRETGNVDLAIQYATKSTEDNDMIWNSHMLLGEIYEEQGELEKAREAYSAAARFNPTDEDLQSAIERVSQ